MSSRQFLGGSDVAYMAHISGTVAGIVIGLVLLLARLVQRDHYDMLAMLNRYRRRKAYEAVVATGYNPFLPSANIPAVAGVAGLFNRGKSVPQVAPPADPRIDSLRTEIDRLIRLHELSDATQRYLELRAIDPVQILPEQHQLDIANQLMADGRYPDAAGAYEDYLRIYPGTSQRDQIMLIPGPDLRPLLSQSRIAPRALFTQVLPHCLHNAEQKAMAEAELRALGDVRHPIRRRHK